MTGARQWLLDSSVELWSHHSMNAMQWLGHNRAMLVLTETSASTHALQVTDRVVTGVGGYI